MNRAPRLAALAALLCLGPALAACGGGDDDGSAGDPPRIEVLDAGTGETQVFALDVERGHREISTITIKEAIDAAGPRVDTPPITLPIVTEVTDVSDDLITVEATYGEPSVGSSGDAAIAGQIQAALGSVEGLRSTSVISPHGESLDSSVTIPDGTDGTVRSLLEQFSEQSRSLAVPFPEEPLGQGARWTVTQHLELNGLEAEQTSTYTLTSLSADGSYDLDVEIRQDYQRGEVQGVTITGGAGSGRGTVSGTIGRLFPTASASTFSNTVSAEAGGSTQSVSTQFSTTVKAEVG